MTLAAPLARFRTRGQLSPSPARQQRTPRCCFVRSKPRKALISRNAPKGWKRPFDDPISLPRVHQTFAIWGKLFTHIHDQEIEISEHCYLDPLT
jgi:hypothetical protein